MTADRRDICGSGRTNTLEAGKSSAELEATKKSARDLMAWRVKVRNAAIVCILDEEEMSDDQRETFKSWTQRYQKAQKDLRELKDQEPLEINALFNRIQERTPTSLLKRLNALRKKIKNTSDRENDSLIETYRLLSVFLHNTSDQVLRIINTLYYGRTLVKLDTFPELHAMREALSLAIHLYGKFPEFARFECLSEGENVPTVIVYGGNTPAPVKKRKVPIAPAVS